MRYIVSFFFLFQIQSFAQISRLHSNIEMLEIVYTSPIDGSRYHNDNRCIILRNDFEISIDNLSSDYEFSIIGENSGNHKFQIKLANDLKTIIFNSEKKFSLGEKVFFSVYKNGYPDIIFDLSFTIKEYNYI